jgi:hypothetical protein
MAIGISFLRLADALLVVLPQIKAETEESGAFRLRGSAGYARIVLVRFV